jgi:hypothetical protein
MEVHVRSGGTPGLHPGEFPAVPNGTDRGGMLTQDYVLGYSQPSLRDSIWRSSSHADTKALNTDEPMRHG